MEWEIRFVQPDLFSHDVLIAIVRFVFFVQCPDCTLAVMILWGKKVERNYDSQHSI